MSTLKRPLTRYFLLAFALTWVFFIPPFLDWLGPGTPVSGPGYNGFANVVSTFGPLAAALIVLWRLQGGAAAWSLIKSGFDLRIRPLVLAAAFLLPIATAYATTLIVRSTGIDTLPGSMVPDNLGYPAVLWLVPAFLSMMFFGGGQEEFGWRGYAQRPMEARWGFLPGTLLLGALWGLWHLPLWILPGDPHIYIPFLLFVVFTMAFSVQMAWLFEWSGHKLAIPWIMHGIQNTVLIVLPVYRLDHDRPQSGLIVYVALNILIAAIMALWRARQRDKRI